MTIGEEIPSLISKTISMGRSGTRRKDLERFDSRSLAQTDLLLEARAPEASARPHRGEDPSLPSVLLNGDGDASGDRVPVGPGAYEPKR